MSVDNLKVAVIQMRATEDKGRNLRRAEDLVRCCAKKGARMILLPETFGFRGKKEQADLRKNVAESLSGPTVQYFKKIARETKTFVVLGSVYESVPGQKKLYNTAVFLDETGRCVGRYRKKNLFAFKGESLDIYEKKTFLPGNRLQAFSINHFQIGAAICYDLRFPGMFQQYARRGCNVMIVSSNFTHETGKGHWEVLLRARAIENKCYILAPNQYGKDSKGVRAYGNSMIVDPWGKILARAGSNREEVLFATLYHKEIDKARKRLP